MVNLKLVSAQFYIDHSFDTKKEALCILSSMHVSGRQFKNLFELSDFLNDIGYHGEYTAKRIVKH